MEMKIGRMPTEQDGKIKFTRKELKQYTYNVANESIMKAMLCVCAYIMDEPEFNFSDERLAMLWTGVERVINTVDEPQTAFTLKNVAKLIKDKTGIEVYW